MSLFPREERHLQNCGVDITNKLMLEDVERFRKIQLEMNGKDILGVNTLMLIAERWQRGRYEHPAVPASPVPQSVAKRGPGRPKKSEMNGS